MNELKKRQLRNKGWFWVDNEIADIYGKYIGAGALAVYLYLCRRANKVNQECFPSQKRIGIDCHIDPKTVRKHIRILRKYNLIYVFAYSSYGKTKHNYVMVDKDDWIEPNSGNLSLSLEGKNTKNNKEKIPTNDTKYKKTKKKETLATNASPNLPDIEKSKEEIRQFFKELNYKSNSP